MRTIYAPGRGFALRDLLFPPQGDCWLCGSEVEVGEDGLCTRCRRSVLRHTEPFCPLCGRSVAERGLCYNCRARPPAYRRGIILFFYQGKVREALHRAKFENDQRAAYALGCALARALRDRGWTDFDGIIPVPIHWMRRLRRGYNVTEVAARAVSEELGIPWWRDVLARRGHTRPKFAMSHEERMHDSGRYEPGTGIDRAAGKRLLLLDDISTTGTTLHQTAEILVRRGCREVTAAALAGNSLGAQEHAEGE